MKKESGLQSQTVIPTEVEESLSDSVLRLVGPNTLAAHG